MTATLTPCIDISSWQSAITWSAVPQEITHVIVRVHRPTGEIDRSAISHADGARQSGRTVSAYAWPTWRGDPIAEAELIYTHQHITNTHDRPLMIDVEGNIPFMIGTITSSVWLEQLATHLYTLSGIKPLVYGPIRTSPLWTHLSIPGVVAGHLPCRYPWQPQNATPATPPHPRDWGTWSMRSGDLYPAVRPFPRVGYQFASVAVTLGIPGRHDANMIDPTYFTTPATPTDPTTAEGTPMSRIIGPGPDATHLRFVSISPNQIDVLLWNGAKCVESALSPLGIDVWTPDRAVRVLDVEVDQAARQVIAIMADGRTIRSQII